MANKPSWMTVLEEADHETAELSLKLQLDDIETAAAPSTNQVATDEGSAVVGKTSEAELTRVASTPSLVEGVTAPVASSTKASAEVTPTKTPGRSAAGLPEEIKALSIRERIEKYFKQPQTDKDAKVVPAPKPIPRFECNACLDRVPADDIYQVPCQHYYCDDCLESLFR